MPRIPIGRSHGQPDSSVRVLQSTSLPIVEEQHVSQIGTSRAFMRILRRPPGRRTKAIDCDAWTGSMRRSATCATALNAKIDKRYHLCVKIPHRIVSRKPPCRGGWPAVGGLWQTPKNAQMLRVAASPRKSRNIAALIAKALPTRPKLSARAAIPLAVAIPKQQRFGYFARGDRD